MKQSRALSGVFVIYTLPALTIFSAILLTLGFMVLILSALAGVHLGESQLHPNPLAAYEALWPGQSASNVEMYSQRTSKGYISCLTSGSALQSYTFARLPDTFQKSAVCMGTPEDGVFQTINLSLDKGYVRGLSLYSDVLQEEALSLYWGAPDAIHLSADRLQLELDWDRHTYTAAASVETTDGVVKTVTLTTK